MNDNENRPRYFANGNHPIYGNGGKRRSPILAILVFIILLVGAVGGGIWFGLRLFEGQDSPATDAPPPKELGELLPDSPPAPKEEAAPPVVSKRPDPVTQTPPVAGKAPKEEKPVPSPVEEDIKRQFAEMSALIQAGKLEDAEACGLAFVKIDYPPKYMAAAYYRLGIIARRRKDEKKAEAYWKLAWTKYPSTNNGRMSAIALADTYYALYVNRKSPDYDKWETIRDLYSGAMAMDGARFMPKTTRETTVKHLTVLNNRLVFSREPCSGAIYHTVEPNMYLLSSIGNHYGVEWSSIQSINHIDPKRVKPGMKLKILKGRCSILVDKANLTLTWYLDGKWIRQYPCAVGPDNKTPAGFYLADSMAKNPGWTNPENGKRYEYGDEENILGTRWIGIEGENTTGLGIHGTTIPSSIPGRTSAGCVRLLNENVQELYGFVSIRAGNETEIRIIE